MGCSKKIVFFFEELLIMKVLLLPFVVKYMKYHMQNDVNFLIKVSWNRLKSFIYLFSPLDTTRKNSWKFKLPNKVERGDFPTGGIDGKENGRKFSVILLCYVILRNVKKKMN